MRVLLVADVSAEKVIGAAERMLARHVHALTKAGDTVSVLTCQPAPGAARKIKLAGGVTEYRLAFSGDRGLSGLWQLAQGAKDWWHEHKETFDGIVAEQPFVMWALWRAGCSLPRLQVCHSLAFEEYATRHGLDWGVRHRLVAAAMRYLEGRVYGSADGLMVLSGHMRRRLHDCFDLGRFRIAVAPGGVDPVSLMEAEAREGMRRRLDWQGPVVVALRNLVPRTGVDMLVQAAAMLRFDMPDVRWCVMGAGPLLEPLKWLAAQLKVEDIVEFTGYLPEQEVAARMQAADAFMLPTRSLEGFGLVTIEANVNGLPVVATPVGANTEVVSGLPCNRLAKSITPEALADSCRLMLEDLKTADRRKIRHKLQQAASGRYSQEAHDQRFIRQLRALVS